MPVVIDNDENTIMISILNAYMTTLFDSVVDVLEDRNRKQKKYTSEDIDKFVLTIKTLSSRLSK